MRKVNIAIYNRSISLTSVFTRAFWLMNFVQNVSIRLKIKVMSGKNAFIWWRVIWKSTWTQTFMTFMVQHSSAEHHSSDKIVRWHDWFIYGGFQNYVKMEGSRHIKFWQVELTCCKPHTRWWMNRHIKGGILRCLQVLISLHELQWLRKRGFRPVSSMPKFDVTRHSNFHKVLKNSGECQLKNWYCRSIIPNYFEILYEFWAIC